MDLQEETADVLGQLIRFNTVNPPGNERECQEWLKAYLEEAGFECELAGTSDERPNLVARLRGESDGPVLGYLSHVDTVLASPEDWSRDPWSGELHDGFVWGRGAVDMKSQTAAEVVAGAALAREGWRPPRGELKIISVADEEVGGLVGAQWLTQERPDLARVDMLLNEGAGCVVPYDGRRLYGVDCAEKGTFRFAVRTGGRAAHASLPSLADNALLKLLPYVERLGTAPVTHDLTDPPRAFLSAVGLDPADPDGALATIRATDERLAAVIEPTFGVTFAPTIIEASTKINVIPAHAELKVDCRMPAGMGAEETMARVREALGDTDGIEIESLQEVIGNSSPVDSPLMDAIRDWIGEAEPGAEVVPIAFWAFTDSRWFRDAFPDCVAYGFFPMQNMTLYDTWPLVHGADERIDVRDLGFAARFYHELPRRLLA
ncbi:MAG TPA: M20/M25/M40 family metallo-hydrolase [Solirubrobacteraceae bacterium]|nr:M20/M25/M40 family metallo-hydrolase [Solirubrobacteraceae bacterium]